MKTFSIDRQDEIHHIMSMLWTVQHLLIEHHDLSMVDRGDLSWTLAHFRGDFEACTDSEEADTRKQCLNTIINLMGAEKDLSAVYRDSLAILLDYLLKRLDKALDRNFSPDN